MLFNGYFNAKACRLILAMSWYKQVQPKHVKEAFRLLNKSIIRVEQPDIHLEEEEAAGGEEQMDVEGDFSFTFPVLDGEVGRQIIIRYCT